MRLVGLGPCGLTLCRERNRVARFSNGRKHCRLFATHYDKLTTTYFVMVTRAAIRIWLRAYAYAT